MGGNVQHTPDKTSGVQLERSTLQWLLYCGGLCLELLGIAFTGAVVVVFFGNVDTRLLLSLTAVGMVLFYGGWFLVRHTTRGGSTTSGERR